MTDPSEVTISDAEVRRLLLRLGVHDNAASEIVARQALAAFLAERVPDALPTGDAVRQTVGPYMHAGALAWNQCRDAVLKGGVRWTAKQDEA